MLQGLIGRQETRGGRWNKKENYDATLHSKVNIIIIHAIIVNVF